MSKSCKDCLYYQMCIYSSGNKRCPCFTDRSEWLHLPCKVGDKVWYITGIGNKLIKPAIVKEIIIDSKGIKDLYVCGNGYNFERSFDIFYLTYKEAKKHLEDK